MQRCVSLDTEYSWWSLLRLAYPRFLGFGPFYGPRNGLWSCCLLSIEDAICALFAIVWQVNFIATSAHVCNCQFVVGASLHVLPWRIQNLTFKWECIFWLEKTLIINNFKTTHQDFALILFRINTMCAEQMPLQINAVQCTHTLCRSRSACIYASSHPFVPIEDYLNSFQMQMFYRTRRICEHWHWCIEPKHWTWCCWVCGHKYYLYSYRIAHIHDKPVYVLMLHQSS